MSRLQRARLYVEGHANRVVRIGELATLTNFSHWYFTKSFHRVYGLSPKDFGIQVRLTQARELLRDPVLTVGEVAAACGFENNSAFARAFRNYYGRPASVLRHVADQRERVPV
ncbi:MAG: helix-turn-helix transcriptional regulator [Ahniella sp.]|nr:helix-turn-helix transcriptional regulator [Ahniella sp.]